MMDPAQVPSHATQEQFHTPTKALATNQPALNLDGLSQAGSAGTSDLARQSLYQNFDPIAASSPPAASLSRPAPSTTPLAASNKLLDFDTPEAYKPASQPATAQALDVMSASPSHLATSLAATKPPSGPLVLKAVVPSGVKEGMKVSDVLEELRVTNLELMALREDCAGLTARIPELEAAVTTYKTLAAKAHEAAQSDVTVRDLQAELASTQQRLAEAEQDFADVDNSYKKLHDRFTRQRGHIEKHVENEHKLKETVAQLQAANSQLKAQYDEMKAYTSDLNNKCNAQILQAKQAQEQEVATLRLQIENLKKQKEIATRDVKQKEQDNTELQEICDRLMATLEGQ
eukprot:m.73143 g.73143  ORF g.73143 m.73143 type:complete len:345 (-) comp14309_c1_seq1:627-1661(-)